MCICRRVVSAVKICLSLGAVAHAMAVDRVETFAILIGVSNFWGAEE